MHVKYGMNVAAVIVALACAFCWNMAFAPTAEAAEQDLAPTGFVPMGAQADDSASASSHEPVYRLYNTTTGEHLYTMSSAERNDLAPRGWRYEGVAWFAPSTGDQVYRLYNTHTGEHLYTMRSEERDMLVQSGTWRFEGDCWRSAPASDASRSSVYRLYNTTTGEHLYTTSADEQSQLLASGSWSDEDIAWHGRLSVDGFADDMAPGSSVLDTWPDSGDVSYSPVYRIYDPVSGDHFLTTNKAERNVVASGYWHYEGISWQAPSAGNPVYRVYNAITGEHLFTMNVQESGALVASGWHYEGVSWYSSTDADSGRVPIYRLYNTVTGEHFFTQSEIERNSLVGSGWRDEGAAWYGHASDSAAQDDLAIWQPNISGDYALDTQLGIILHSHGSLRSAYDYVVSFPYISGNRFYEDPHFLPDSTTIAFALEMISQHGGNCYRFASLFSWLARGLGYDSRVVSGWVPSYSGGRAPHGWVEITIDGGVYIFDPDMAEAMPSVDWYMRTYDNPPTNYGSW